MARRSKFTMSQIYKILLEARVRGIAETARRRGISEQTIRRWREKYEVSQEKTLNRLKQLEKENQLLKQMIAERDMEIVILQTILEELEKQGFFGSKRTSPSPEES